MPGKLAKIEQPIINERDFYWLAGILEGEGSFILSRDGNYAYAHVSMNSIDKDVIDRVANLVKGGCITRHTYRLRPNQQDTWHWQLRKSRLAVDFMIAIRPLMSNRRKQQIERVLAGVTSG